MMVEYAGGMKFVARHRDHELTTDLTESGGGANTAMSPPEVFIAALATCIGVYVVNFAKRHQIPVEGMTIDADWQVVDGPRRVGAIQIGIKIPGTTSGEHRAALKRVAQQCLVHNTLHHAPDIDISVG